MNNEPSNDLEEAADLAFKAAEAYLELHGLTMAKAILSIQIEQSPVTGDSVTAMHAIEDPEEALTWLAGTMGGLAKQLGFELRFIPVGHG